MAIYYVNTVFRHVTQNQTVDALRYLRRTAFVFPEVMQHVTVIDCLCSDELSDIVTDEFASALTGQLNCASLSFTNSDNDVLWIHTHLNGRLLDTYVSRPDLAHFEREIVNSSGDASLICNIWGHPNRVGKLEKLLSDSELTEIERHQAIREMLGISKEYSAARYEFLEKAFPEKVCTGCVIALSLEEIHRKYTDAR
jgi:tryptophan 2,3-dioxygenase